MIPGPSSKIYTKGEGHTGFVLSFNKQFLEKYTFNESFMYGGYDYFLTCAIMGECMSQFIDEYKKVPKILYDYIDSDVIHNYHGSKLERKTQWDKYSF